MSSWFSSRRERRLWTWTLAVVVAIYSTIPFAGTLVGVTPSADQMGFFGRFVMFLIGAMVLTEGLRIKPGGAEIGIALGVVGAFLLLFLRLGFTPAERTHLMEYAVVAVFMYQALLERVSQGQRVPFPALLAMLGTSLIGVIDECIQFFMPSRVFDPIDILFNTLAAVTVVGASVVLAWARQRWAANSARRRHV